RARRGGPPAAAAGAAAPSRDAATCAGGPRGRSRYTSRKKGGGPAARCERVILSTGGFLASAAQLFEHFAAARADGLAMSISPAVVRRASTKRRHTIPKERRRCDSCCC